MKVVVAAFYQEKALVGAFSVITNLQMQLFEALVSTISVPISSHDEKQPDTDLATKFFVFEGADCDVTYTVKVTLGIYLIYI